MDSRQKELCDYRISRAEDSLKAAYITNQSELASLKFGKSNMAYAGCEIITIYNAILLKTKEVVPLSDAIAVKVKKNNRIETYNKNYRV